MLESIYLFLATWAAIMMIIGLALGEAYPVFSLFASILMGILALLSANVQVPFCETAVIQTNTTIANITHYTSTWSCTTYRQLGDLTGLIYLFGGLSAIMFVIFIADALGFSFRSVKKAVSNG